MIVIGMFIMLEWVEGKLASVALRVMECGKSSFIPCMGFGIRVGKQADSSIKLLLVLF